MSGYLVLLVLAAVVVLNLAGWFITPKGNQQTLIRTMIILTLWCCFLMWSITYMAQLHPLIAPRRADIRFEEKKHGKTVL
ncbi:H(+)-transporting V0 sector ATPase subunit e [Serendipita sp. 398]|nr:H(+)-transporting V0 sector ATPase subunit e [Serendipita sp. 398]